MANKRPIISLILGVAVLSNVMSACTPATPTPSPTSPAERTQAVPAAVAQPTQTTKSEPAKPATASATTELRVPLNGDAPTLDPQAGDNLITNIVTQNVYASLVDLDQEGKPVPGLAKSWDISTDATLYTFHLVTDAKFQDGSPITSADVKYSFERVLLPATKAAAPLLMLGDVEGAEEMLAGKATELSGIKLPDPATVQIQQKKPGRGDLLARVSSPRLGVVKKANVEGAPDWFLKPVGSGPYVLKEYTEKSRFVLEASPHYFRGEPKIKTVTMPIVTDATTGLAQYENGEVDVVQVPLEDLNRIRSDTKLKDQLKEFDRSQTMFLALNQAVYPPFSDVRVRQAIAYSIDKETIVKQVFQGAARVANGMLPPGDPAYDATFKGLPYDPTKARQLLEAAGYPEGKGLPPGKLTYNPLGTSYKNIAEPASAMLKQNIGLEFPLQTTEYARFIADMNKKDVLAAYLAGWSQSWLDPNYYLDQLFYSKSSLNRMNYRSEEFDKVLDAANAAATPAERTRLFQEAQAKLIDDAPVVPVLTTKYDFLVKPYVKNLRTSSLNYGLLPFYTVSIEK
jgi:oligopeptide transport system substrate-binding protein